MRILRSETAVIFAQLFSILKVFSSSITPFSAKQSKDLFGTELGEILIVDTDLEGFFGELLNSAIWICILFPCSLPIYHAYNTCSFFLLENADWVESISSSQDETADPSLWELKWSWSQLFEDLTLLETVGETDCRLDLFPASLPGLDAGDNPRLDAGTEPVVLDMGRSLIDVRSFGGGSAVNPGMF